MASGFITSRSRGPQLDVRNKCSVNGFLFGPQPVRRLTLNRVSSVFFIRECQAKTHLSGRARRHWTPQERRHRMTERQPEDKGGVHDKDRSNTLNSDQRRAQASLGQRSRIR
jgi:hypothetical protein